MEPIASVFDMYQIGLIYDLVFGRLNNFLSGRSCLQYCLNCKNTRQPSESNRFSTRPIPRKKQPVFIVIFNLLLPLCLKTVCVFSQIPFGRNKKCLLNNSVFCQSCSKVSDKGILIFQLGRLLGLGVIIFLKLPM